MIFITITAIKVDASEYNSREAITVKINSKSREELLRLQQFAGTQQFRPGDVEYGLTTGAYIDVTWSELAILTRNMPITLKLSNNTVIQQENHYTSERYRLTLDLTSGSYVPLSAKNKRIGSTAYGTDLYNYITKLKEKIGVSA